MEESSRLDFVRAQNNPNATAEAEEAANHRERVKRIMELMSLDGARARRLLALENQRNALEKQKIATQIRRQSEDAEFQIRQQEIESQKLSEQVQILNKRRSPNRPGPSEDMQRQLDRDRAIEEFRRRTDLTEQQRQRLIDNENLNYFLRSQAARPPMFEQNAPVSQGFLGAGSVANRILPQAMDPLTSIASGVSRVVQLFGNVDRALREGGTVALEIE
jgi:hypothetical protein